MAYYIYLISSLPVLNFLSKPAIGLEEFLQKCKGLVPEKEIGLLHSACYEQPDLLNISSNETLEKWVNFETGLRNALVKARARRKKTDPQKFIRLPDSQDAHISHVAMASYRMQSLFEAEKSLDQERWNYLEYLSTNHFFDLDFLLTYALKLKILKRWDRIQKADKESLFNQTLLT
jgi:hypothetical protein